MRYFAAAREATGLSEESVEVEDGSTAGTLFETLATRYPALRTSPLRLAVEETFVEEDAPLSHGATMALIPPVGGG